jgi:hypothetical protein
VWLKSSPQRTPSSQSFFRFLRDLCGLCGLDGSAFFQQHSTGRLSKLGSGQNDILRPKPFKLLADKEDDTEKTWSELVDEDDEPVLDERYCITSPDGWVAERTWDQMRKCLEPYDGLGRGRWRSCTLPVHIAAELQQRCGRVYTLSERPEIQRSGCGPRPWEQDQTTGSKRSHGRT